MTITIPPPPVVAQLKKPRVIDVFLRYLKAEGVGVVFGIPGGLLHPFFEHLENDPDIDLVVAKHEEGAAFMADGYARVGRRLGMCAATSGPGATNLVTGVACAFSDAVPMIVLSGQAATHVLGKGAAQETSREDMDIVGLFRPITKYSAMVSNAAAFPQHLRRALRQALTGRPGPVHLNVPVDIWERPLEEEWFDPKTYRPQTTTFDRTAVQRAAVSLLNAKRPAILAGAGVHSANAAQHLRALAELLPARVATTPRGKGLFPESHPLSVGVLGFAGHRQAREVMLGNDVDVILTVGTSLNETATLNWSPKLRENRTFIQVDIDAERVGRNYPVDVALIGDAQVILVELAYHLHRLIREGGASRSTWASAPPVERGHDAFVASKSRASDAFPLTPERWRVDLQEALPANAIIFSDVGGHMLSNIHHLVIGDGQSFVLNLGFGSMGHGTCAPIGASYVAGNRPVFAIIGDACFTMNGMELLTAVEHQRKVIWIVENNNMHGITWHASKLVGLRKPLESARYKRNVDVAAIALAMGLMTQVVDKANNMQGAVQRALAHNGPCLIEVRVDPDCPPPLEDRVRSVAGGMESNEKA